MYLRAKSNVLHIIYCNLSVVLFYFIYGISWTTLFDSWYSTEHYSKTKIFMGLSHWFINYFFIPTASQRQNCNDTKLPSIVLLKLVAVLTKNYFMKSHVLIPACLSRHFLTTWADICDITYV